MKTYLAEYLIFLNIIGFLSMYVDKVKARNKKWRIKESTLLFIAILGGSLGSYLGMKAFRHKTKHNKFVYGIPIILIIQLVLIKSVVAY
ncbi:DUF1294 domain-containing protein [Clostridium sp. MB40-C1]|uniref:DUF1294 domain-containing protein n=1 Tax=Clostridium sp. MB40-C1 TaxID=3070996 RepID=UPI0027E185B4|nr:DUF1294 domain-containing protein [Clostridium sp. MB40-C1]WMJ81897.1 DUF1294 domain-containing protein [Clostridium sp. MB40-C1]